MTVQDWLLSELAKATAEYKKAQTAVDSYYSSALFEPSARLDRLRTWIDTLPPEIMTAKIKKKANDNNDSI